MKSNLRSSIEKNGPALLSLALLLGLWEAVCVFGLVPPYLLPSPAAVCGAVIKDAPLLAAHALYTLQEAFWGLFFGVIAGCFFAVLMERFPWIHRAVYPILVITQTIPAVAIAPLLVLWFGYEMLPKIILIVLVTFFPVTVGVFSGLVSVDEDQIKLFRAMGANAFQIFVYLKWPTVLPEFFAALRIAAAYSVVGAVIAEWLGGFHGLGVYMIRVKAAFAFDKMFAVILIISLISLALMKVVEIVQKKCMPYL